MTAIVMFHVTPIYINVMYLCITAPYTMRSQWVLARTDKGQIYRTNRVGTTKTQHNNTAQQQLYRTNRVGTTTTKTNNTAQQQIYRTNRVGKTTTHNTTTNIQDQQVRYNITKNQQQQQIHRINREGTDHTTTTI